ncbi:MAG: translation initiation factor IF-2 [Candidatus Syntrophonatronum acetioxidans]|uniref:Translation initiation factor IF-2 n=1 Tax=Candidatus Syntrophonatronum acetioxidans TaxID=1795816 RepID=A0A424YDC0_9FIRM|nr:MAG: translation initiation factor IF-2 [Candidatus Syntrophonatronum acetioxidans]
MERIRIYELAKRLGLSSKEVIATLKDLDIPVKNHMSSIDDETADMLMDLLTRKDDNDDNKEAKEAVKEDKSRSKTEDKKKDKREIKEKEGKELLVRGSKLVKDLADELGLSPNALIGKLLGFGVMVNINQEVEPDIIKKLGEELGYQVTVEIPEKPSQVELLEEEEDRPEDLKPRPPVVTVLGHVDHGKTSLLDAIRETDVIAQEAGGITQHIGASQVVLNDDVLIFLDTPGHEAFTAMRARGAQVTDIAVLVVAADDGVMPQTVEAINHVKAAGVPIIVALNKIDKPDANPDKVKQQLTEYGLIPEEWGGDTICVPVSAKKKEGIDNLLEMILLVAEMSELKANPSAPARGTVVEAKLDRGRGPVATLLIQKGTLQVGDPLVCGSIYGKVRALINDKGQKVKKATPSTPVEVLGFSDIPEAGDIFQVIKDDKKARQIAEKRAQSKREAELQKTKRVSLDDLYRHIQEGEIKELNLIIKGDVQGSVGALKDSLLKISTEDVRLQVIHSGVGAVTESDVMLASASNAIIIGFNVRPEPSARKMAEMENVEIKTYRVIYEVIEDIKKAMTGLLEPEYEEVTLGRAEVRQTFKVSRLGTIAGCYVIDGKITRDSGVRVIRDNVVIHEGKISSLKRFKDDVKEVAEGFECGLMIEKFNDIKEGDILESFIMQEVKI